MNTNSNSHNNGNGTQEAKHPRNERLVFLRVKIKALAEESKIIRLETKRAKARGRGGLVNGLTDHRKFAVRSAARRTQLVYGYLREKPYLGIETAGSARMDSRDLKDMARMAVKYGPELAGYFYQSDDRVRAMEEALKNWLMEGNGMKATAGGGVEPRVEKAESSDAATSAA